MRKRALWALFALLVALASLPAIAQVIPTVVVPFSFTTTGTVGPIVLNGQTQCSVVLTGSAAGLQMVPQAASTIVSTFSTVTTMNSGLITANGTYPTTGYTDLTPYGVGPSGGFQLVVNAISSGTGSGTITCVGPTQNNSVVLTSPIPLPVAQANTPGVFCVNCNTSPPYVAPTCVAAPNAPCVQLTGLPNPLPVTTPPPYVAPTCPAAPNAPCVQLTGLPNPLPVTTSTPFVFATNAGGQPIVAQGAPGPTASAWPFYCTNGCPTPYAINTNPAGQARVAQGSPGPSNRSWYTKTGTTLDSLIGGTLNVGTLNNVIQTTPFNSDLAAITWEVTSLTGSGATITNECTIGSTNFFPRYTQPEPSPTPAAPTATITKDGQYTFYVGTCVQAELLVTSAGSNTNVTVSWNGTEKTFANPAPSPATFNCAAPTCPSFPPTVALSPVPTVGAVIFGPPPAGWTAAPVFPIPTDAAGYPIVHVTNVPAVTVTGAPPPGWTPYPWPTDNHGYPIANITSLPAITCAANGCPTPNPDATGSGTLACQTLNSAVTDTLTFGQSVVGWYFPATTCNAIVTFEGSVDGTNWLPLNYALNSAAVLGPGTAAGSTLTLGNSSIARVSTAGIAQARVRVSSANITVNETVTYYNSVSSAAVFQGGPSWTVACTNCTPNPASTVNVTVLGPPPAGWTPAPIFPLPTDAAGIPLAHATGTVTANQGTQNASQSQAWWVNAPTVNNFPSPVPRATANVLTNGPANILANGYNVNGGQAFLFCPSQTPIAVATTAPTQLVAAVAAQNIYVCGFSMTLAGTTPTAKFTRAAAAGCSSSAVALTGVYAPVAGSYMSYGGSFGFPIFQTSAADQEVCIVLTGTGASAQGILNYDQF